MAPSGPAAWTVGLLLAASAGCGSGGGTPGALAEMLPAAGYDDRPIAAIIEGGPFRPSYRFDAQSGSADIDVGGFSAELTPSGAAGPGVSLASVAWEAVDMLAAVVPAGLAAGAYDLSVRDPRGQVARLAGAFQSLGADGSPPTVQFASPADGAIFATGATVPVVVEANDGYGQLGSLIVTVTSPSTPVPPNDCTVANAAALPCTFSFEAPPPGDTGSASLQAVAVDIAGNSQSVEIALVLVTPSGVSAFSPAAGSTNGGTMVTVTGSNFLDGATTVSFDGVAATGYLASATSFVATAPPHVAGPATVAVTTGGATATAPGQFQYVPPPVVRELGPSHGPAAGGTPVIVVGDNFQQGTTQIWFQGVPLVAPSWVSANQIDGVAPPGTGTALVTATDPVGGAAQSGASYVYDPTDAGVSIDFQGSGVPGARP